MSDSKTYQQWLNEAIQSLSLCLTSQEEQASAKVDAYVLLEYITQKNKASIFAFPETELTEQQLIQLEELLQRRIQGEPIAYILGERDFWSLTLAVSPDTLIPRADTEILVEHALAKVDVYLQSESFKSRCQITGKKELNILDLGTGTGAIALALASELAPICQGQNIQLNVVGVDFIANAVALAQQNGQRNQLEQVTFLQSNWFENIDQRFDIIVSNPPYIDKRDHHLTQGDLCFEPLSALIAEEEGYADLRFIIQQAPQYLTAEGWLLLEHGFEQGPAVREIFSAELWQHIATVKDYGNNDRVTLAQKIIN